MEEFSRIKEKIGFKLDKLKKKIKEKKINTGNKDSERQLKIGLSVLALVLLIFTINYKTKALEINLNGLDLGIVRSEDVVDQIMDELKEELQATHNMDIVFDKEIEFKETNARDKNLTDRDEIKDKLKERISFLVEGYVLEIEGEKVAALRSKEDIEEVIDRLKENYIEGLDGVKETKLIEKIEIKKEELPLYRITTAEKLEEILKTGGEKIDTHIVEVGESLWTIAKIYDLTMDELIEANSDRNPDDLQIGDEIKLVKSQPLLTVATVVEKEYEKTIDFESELELDDNMYDNEKEVKVEGVKGKSKVLAREVRHNGVLISEDILEEEVIEEPVKELVVKGTKEVPRTVATGSFIMPTRGRISSRYGMRNGRMHKGLDISASTGTPIYAADGGKVIKTGWQGAYGNIVEIDHGNGYKTKYAHCSKILVSQGERVYKGQHIANVGNTGRSTGSHLHLEVIKNGKNINPSQYVQ